MRKTWDDLLKTTLLFESISVKIKSTLRLILSFVFQELKSWGTVLNQKMRFINPQK